MLLKAIPYAATNLATCFPAYREGWGILSRRTRNLKAKDVSVLESGREFEKSAGQLICDAQRPERSLPLARKYPGGAPRRRASPHRSAPLGRRVGEPESRVK